MGFKISPYGKYIASTFIDGYQCTIAWYVDDIKISHNKQQVLVDIIKLTKDAFSNLKVAGGNKRNFLAYNLR